MSEKKYSDLCTQESLTYAELDCDVFEADADGGGRLSIRRYLLPFPQEKQKALYQIHPELARKNRINEYYGQVAAAAANDYKVSKVFEQEEIRSTVRYKEISRVKTEEGNGVYLVSDHLTPLYKNEGSPSLTIGMVVDMARRLLAICMDMEECGYVHRNINAHNVFYDSDNRIQLGGFGYSAVKGTQQAPVPHDTAHVAPDVLSGQLGSLASDMFSITSLMGCLLNGQGTDTTFNGKVPLMPQIFYDAMALGFSMDPEKAPEFRAKLNRIYKEGRTLFWDMPVIQLYQMRLAAGPGSDAKAETTVVQTPGAKMKKPGLLDRMRARRAEKKSEKEAKAKQRKDIVSEEENTAIDPAFESQTTERQEVRAQTEPECEPKTADPLAYADDYETVDETDEDAVQTPATETTPSTGNDSRGKILSFAVGVAVSAMICCAAYLILSLM